ncbi:MAG: hypothetical protein PHS41_09920 [Victivallaceae bacterium]|nr:hypothetical protein [Victivallaceae bacterium]
MADTDTQSTPRQQGAVPEDKSTQKFAINDPLSRKTNTGRLGMLSDTQTRRTIRLRPVNPAAAAQQAGSPATDPAAGSPAAAPVGGKFTATATQKTVVLRPANGKPLVAAGKILDVNTRGIPSLKPRVAVATPIHPTAEPVPESAAAPEPVSASPEEENTISIKVVPATPEMQAPETTVSAATAEAETVAIPKRAPEPMMPSLDHEDRNDTIKIKRPQGAIPLTPAARATAASAGITLPADGEKTILVKKPETAKPVTLKPVTLTPLAPVSAQPAAPTAEEASTPHPTAAQSSSATVAVPKIKPQAITPTMTPLQPPPVLRAQPKATPAAPPVLKPAGAAAPTLKPLGNATPAPAAEAPAPAPQPAAEAATPQAPPKGLSLGLKKKQESAPAPAPAPAPETANTAAAPEGQKVAEESEEEAFARAKAFAEAKARAKNGKNGQLPYLLVAVVTLILVAASAVLCTLQYLNTYEKARLSGKEIEVPMIGNYIKL